MKIHLVVKEGAFGKEIIGCFKHETDANDMHESFGRTLPGEPEYFVEDHELIE
jgi:hypothetical protein